MNFSYSGMATAGGAALVKPGRRLFRSAYSVNCDTTSSSPPAAARFRFILSASSEKTRRPQILSAILSASASVSSGPTPSRTRKPLPIFPTVSPSMATEAEETLVTTARIVKLSPLCGFLCVSLLRLNKRKAVFSIARRGGSSQRYPISKHPHPNQNASRRKPPCIQKRMKNA